MVGFQVYRSKGSVVVSVEDGVKEAIADLEATLSEDINFQLIYTEATEIRDSYQASIDRWFWAAFWLLWWSAFSCATGGRR